MFLKGCALLSLTGQTGGRQDSLARRRPIWLAPSQIGHSHNEKLVKANGVAGNDRR